MIGWYVHHHGSGHRTRAAVIAPVLARLTGEPVVCLSSVAAAADWVELPRDEVADPVDPTARGTLHWAPRRAAGIADRAAALTAWLARERPRALVVDVSVETALLARLAGIPVVTVALPGDRDDEAHHRAFAAADLVLAFWPREVYDPPWLHPHRPRVRYVGAVSRFDRRPRATGRGGVVLLDGTGGSDFGAVPREWRVLSGAGRVDDPWSALCGADVVVSHAGQNAVAELAAAGARAVLVPQARPFAEQARTVEALTGAGLAVGATGRPEGWEAALAAAATLDPARWARWSDGAGADRAAAAIADVAAA